MTANNRAGVLAVFLTFLRLGLTSFGGPIAHLAYFHEEFVSRRKWLSEQSYADLIALCQFLPGPASSQVCMSIGLTRAGFAGAIAAWIGFTLPSAIILILFALGVSTQVGALSPGALHGLKIVAVAVVAQAIWGMAKKLCPDIPRAMIAFLSSCLALLSSTALGQVGIIAGAAIIGLLIFKPSLTETNEALLIHVSRRFGTLMLVLFFGILIILPTLVKNFPNETLALIDTFYRAGSLVFGGGHVVLPLLQAEVVPNGWITNDLFLAGYGAAQAIPGPLFTFSAFLGTAITMGYLGGILCLVAIFLPSFLLISGILPFWEQLRQNAHIQAALMGVNAAVVGLLVAAFYSPVWTNAIFKLEDFGLALFAFIALMFLKLPPWLVVICSGTIGWLYL